MASRILFLFTFLVTLYTACGLQCYVCKEQYVAGQESQATPCYDSFVEGQSSQISKVKCPDSAKLCSKSLIVQKDISKGQVYLAYREVIRNCSSNLDEMTSPGCHHYIGNMADQKYCTCSDADGCNAASGVHLHILLLLAALFLAFKMHVC